MFSEASSTFPPLIVLAGAGVRIDAFLGKKLPTAEHIPIALLHLHLISLGIFFEIYPIKRYSSRGRFANPNIGILIDPLAIVML
jgi:hypothetical protein